MNAKGARIPEQMAPGRLHTRMDSPWHPTDPRWGLSEPQKRYWTPLHPREHSPHSVHCGAAATVGTAGVEADAITGAAEVPARERKTERVVVDTYMSCAGGVGAGRGDEKIVGPKPVRAPGIGSSKKTSSSRTPDRNQWCGVRPGRVRGDG